MLRLGLVGLGLGVLSACEAVQDPLGRARTLDDPYDTVRIRAPVGVAFALRGGLDRNQIHVMCADGGEDAVQTRLERHGSSAAVVLEGQPVGDCVVTVCSDAVLDVIDDTAGSLDLTTSQAIRLGSVWADRLLLHTSVAGSFLVDDITVQDATLDARGTSVIEVGRIEARRVAVRTDGSAQAAVRDAQVVRWEADAWAHASQLGAGAAEHVKIYGRGDGQVQMMDVTASSAEIDLAGRASAWLDVDPRHAETSVAGEAELTLGDRR